MKDYHLINLLNIIVIFVVTGICSKDGYHHISCLDILTRKSSRCQHHRENYLENLQQGIIISSLKLKKKPAILPVSADFEEKWKLILNEVEKKLVEEL